MTKRGGFTLIEVLIVLAIMSILLVGSIAALTSSRSASLMQESEKQLASEISLAKAYAIQGNAKTVTVHGVTQALTPCGYGVRFDSLNRYVIYYNFLVTGDSTIADCDDQNKNQNYLKYKSLYSYNTDYENLAGQTKVGSTGNLVYFTVPNGQVYGVDGSPLAAQETITLNAGSLSKNVYIETTGLVTIDN